MKFLIFKYPSIFILVCLVINGYSQTYTWTGTTNNDWDVSTNWTCTACTPGTYPDDAADNVVINLATANISMTTSYTINQFTMTTGTLNIVGTTTLTADNTISMSGGTITGNSGSAVNFTTGQNILLSGTTAITTEDVTLQSTSTGRRLDIDGTVTLGSMTNPGIVILTNTRTSAVNWDTNLTIYGNTTINHNGTNNGTRLSILNNANEFLTVNGNLIINDNSTNNNNSYLRIANGTNNRVNVNGNLEVNSSVNEVSFNAQGNNNPVDTNNLTSVTGTFSANAVGSELNLNYVTVGMPGGTVNVTANFKAEQSTIPSDATINGTIDIDDSSITGENVILSTTGTIRIDGSTTLGNGTASSSISITNNSNNVTSINGNLIFDGNTIINNTGGDANSDIRILNNANDRLEVNGNLAISNTGTNNQSHIRIANSTDNIIEISGNLELNSAATTDDISINSSNLNSNITQVGGIFSSSTGINGSALNLNYVDIQTAGGSATVNANFKAEESIIPTDLTINGGVINIDNTELSGSDVTLISGVDAAINIDGDVTIGNGSGTITLTNQDNNSITWTGDIELNGTTTINNNATGSANFTILDNPTDELTVNGPITFNANMGADFNLINNGSTARFRSDITTNTTVGHSFNFGNGGGNIIIDGNTSQTIDGNAGEITFNNLEMNTTGSLVLEEDVVISNTLTLTSGIIDSDESTADDILIINDNVTVTGGTDGSHVDGYVRKIGNDDFTFPVGDNGIYQPIRVANFSNNSSRTLDAQYINNPFSNRTVASSDPSGEDLLYVSNCEHWELEQSSGNVANIDITMDYKPYSSGCSGVGDPPNLRASRFDGTEWLNEGGMGTASGTGSITTTFLSTDLLDDGNPVPFTIATLTFNNPLPVTLINFKVSKKSEGIGINWQTSSEINHSHFVVERSSDGFEFKELIKVQGKGDASSSINTYDVTDSSPINGSNYYRLRSVDLDETFEFSKVEVIHFEIQENSDIININAFPNPVNFQTSISFSKEIEELQWQVFDLQGRIIEENQSFQTTKILLNLSNYKSGTYIFQANTKTQRFIQKIIKK